jgi:hypothetical protein
MLTTPRPRIRSGETVLQLVVAGLPGFNASSQDDDLRVPGDVGALMDFVVKRCGAARACASPGCTGCCAGLTWPLTHCRRALPARSVQYWKFFAAQFGGLVIALAILHSHVCTKPHGQHAMHQGELHFAAFILLCAPREVASRLGAAAPR